MQARDADGPVGGLDTEAWFGRSAPMVLEIGCGAGTSTLAMAQAEPDIDVVAVEVYRRGLAQLLAASSGKASPISGWSAATASTCSSTCSPPTR